MRPLFDILSIIVATVAHPLAGFSLVVLGHHHGYMHESQDLSLALPTSMAIAYTSTIAPIICGIILAFISALVASLAYRNEKSRAYLPFLLTLSFTILILHIMFVVHGVSLPLFRSTWSLGTP